MSKTYSIDTISSDDNSDIFTEQDALAEIGYRGNKNLRRSGIRQKWTKKQLLEYKKCFDDPVYFIKKYVKIVHVDKGIIPFELWDFQIKLIEDLHNNRFIAGLWPRQSGKSTTIAAYMLHFVLFNGNKKCAILANKAAGAREILGRIQMAYELLPFWMKMGILDWNKGNLNLENGSSIIAAATSSSAIRGTSLSFLLLDEFAFVPKNMAEDFFRSVYPTISSGKDSKIAIISTPFGMNHYYKMWNEAVSGTNGYVANRALWSNVPGRDKAWKALTIKNIGEEAFNQEFECEFLGSSGTLISTSKLQSMPYMTPIFQDNDGFKMYYPPEPGRSYLMTVDTAEGLGLDSHGISVFDVTETPYQQVATYKNSFLDPLLLPDMALTIAEKYNRAFVLVELNHLGPEVANTLYMDLEYENMMFTTMNGRNGQVLGGGFSGKTQFGLKTTSQSKRISCSLTKTLIENDQLIINDFDTYSEFTTFIRSKNSYNAEEGCNDDMVTTVRLFAWITGQRYFKEEMEQDLRTNLNRQSIDRMEEMLVPFGIIDDGLDSIDINRRINEHLNFKDTFDNSHNF
jgi:hypothetical protein